MYAKSTVSVLRESSARTYFYVTLGTLRNRRAKRYCASSRRCAFQYFSNIFLTVPSNYLNAAWNNSFHSYTFEEAQGLPHFTTLRALEIRADLYMEDERGSKEYWLEGEGLVPVGEC